MTENHLSLFSLPECAEKEGSPVFISGGSLLRYDESESIKACLKLKNVSDKEVSAVSIHVIPFDKDGHDLAFDTEVDRIGPYKEEGPHEIRDITLPFMTRSFSADIVRAVFADGSIWEVPSDMPVISPAPEKRADTEAVNAPAENTPAAETASQAGDKPVSADAPADASDSSLDDRGSSDTGTDNVEQHTTEAEMHSEDQKAAQDSKPEHSFSFKKLLVILIPAVLILSGLAIIFIGAYLPERRYTNAVELYNSGRLEEAITAFNSMNGYKDSASYIYSAETALAYQAAVASFEEGDYDSAYKGFTKLGDFGNSAEWAAKSKTGIFSIAYGEADSLLRKGKMAEAADAFYQIRSYSDSWDRCFNIWGRIAGRKTISAGGHTVCLTDEGNILYAGNNDNGELDLSLWRDIEEVSAGNEFTAGLRADGTVVATGNNEYGQCDVADWQDIVSVCAGYWNTAGVKADGTVIIAGRECDVSGWSNIKSVSSSIFHTVGLRTDGTVVAAETKDILGTSHNYGQNDVSYWKDIIAVSTGVSFTVGLRKDGTVVAVGDNTYGQCNVDEWEDIVAISANGWHVVGLKADGTVVAAGWNENGECDIDSWEDIVAISTGTSHTIGLKADGTLVAVGNNKDGRCDVAGWQNIRSR